jgi:hypothetical protein
MYSDSIQMTSFKRAQEIEKARADLLGAMRQCELLKSLFPMPQMRMRYSLKRLMKNWT